MMRKIKRTRDFELTLNIANDDFIRPPRAAQRNWLLNQAMAEFAADLNHLHEVAADFVPGQESFSLPDRTQVELTDEEIMEDWQIPIMEAMAERVAGPENDVLEIGFGRGVSAEMIQRLGVKSHTIVECNDSIVDRFTGWREKYPEREIHLLHGMWQDLTDRFALYDGIFFHTYALDDEEYMDTALKSVTFAEHFFPTAAAHLRPGGKFTYLTNEIDSFSRAHQRLVFRYFSSFSLAKISPLNLSPDIRDTWWADSMIVIEAVK